MRYFFENIETMNASDGYAHLQIKEHYADIPPIRTVKVVDGKKVIEEVEDTVSMLYAEKLGGVLEPKPARKSTKSEPKAELSEPETEPKDGK